jgi:hypothetical protein
MGHATPVTVISEAARVPWAAWAAPNQRLHTANRLVGSYTLATSCLAMLFSSVVRLEVLQSCGFHSCLVGV